MQNLEVKVWPVKSIEALNLVSAAVRSKVMDMLLLIHCVLLLPLFVRG